ncbi:hypothetical protein L596_021163 [Steinernema carpocapsae]|uniref:Uncharacterized protein n=1 Tax=Steinernema carpocapsae TaxID=34508 RepID=A0A4U5MVX2_STECR|nr:hypothetical protein L596_021163 [Steinernema carpocapsae]
MRTKRSMQTQNSCSNTETLGYDKPRIQFNCISKNGTSADFIIGEHDGQLMHFEQVIRDDMEDFVNRDTPESGIFYVQAPKASQRRPVQRFLSFPQLRSGCQGVLPLSLMLWFDKGDKVKVTHLSTAKTRTRGERSGWSEEGDGDVVFYQPNIHKAVACLKRCSGCEDVRIGSWFLVTARYLSWISDFTIAVSCSTS